jgi:hypothetical protein
MGKERIDISPKRIHKCPKSTGKARCRQSPETHKSTAHAKVASIKRSNNKCWGDAGRMATHPLLAEMQNGIATVETSRAVPQKANTDSAIPLPFIHPREMKAHVQTKTCTCTFRVKRRKQMSFNQ